MVAGVNNMYVRETGVQLPSNMQSYYHLEAQKQIEDYSNLMESYPVKPPLPEVFALNYFLSG